MIIRKAGFSFGRHRCNVWWMQWDKCDDEHAPVFHGLLLLLLDWSITETPWFDISFLRNETICFMVKKVITLILETNIQITENQNISPGLFLQSIVVLYQRSWPPELTVILHRQQWHCGRPWGHTTTPHPTPPRTDTLQPPGEQNPAGQSTLESQNT